MRFGFASRVFGIFYSQLCGLSERDRDVSASTKGVADSQRTGKISGPRWCEEYKI